MYPSFTINPVDTRNALEVDQLTEQLGLPNLALGNLVTVVEKLACVQQSVHIDVGELSHTIFCADHGVYPRSHASSTQAYTTADFVHRLLKARSPLAKACAMNKIDFTVVDCGLNHDVNLPHENFLNYAIANGTRDFTTLPAMTHEQFLEAFNIGQEIAQLKMAEGAKIISFGALALGNTTSAAAITSHLLKLPIEECIKNFSHYDAQLMQDKLHSITQALVLHRDSITDGFSAVELVGGFEIAALMGAMAITAELGGLILVDGFACSAALLALSQQYPAVADYALFTHQSVHAGQLAICQHFRQKPLLNLGLSVGEGTGSVLAWPIIKSAVNCLQEDEY